MNRKERILSVLKGLVMAAAGIFLLMVENMWFREQKSGVTGSIRIEGLLVITGLALLVLGVAFIRDGCRRKKTSSTKEVVLTACPYCGANVQGKERICLICGKDMYEVKKWDSF